MFPLLLSFRHNSVSHKTVCVLALLQLHQKEKQVLAQPLQSHQYGVIDEGHLCTEC